jgi:hypothetical protein
MIGTAVYCMRHPTRLDRYCTRRGVESDVDLAIYGGEPVTASVKEPPWTASVEDPP